MSKHIRTAKAEGAEAGLATLVEYVESPLGAANPHMAEVIEELDGLRTKAQRLSWYCKRFDVPKKAAKSSAKASSKGKAAAAARKGNSRKSAKASVSNETITKGEAWAIQGSDPDYEPTDHDAPAGGRVLYRLNTLGLLSVS